MQTGNTSNNGPRGHALRLGRHSMAGQVYLVTAVTRDRRPVFADFGAARQVVRALREEHLAQRGHTWAYVVMPDHLHWLFALGDGAALSQVVRTVKAVTAHRLGGGLWQKGFHDRALRREESLIEAARYVVRNPVRAGLVNRVGDYPHWDAAWLE